EQLAQPAREFPAFPAALSFLPLLTPDDVRRQLETRIAALTRELARTDALREGAEAMQVPRLFLLESELMRATLKTELDWVTSVVDDLKAGNLTWSEQWLREIAERFAPLADAATSAESSTEN
ncbi:MAG TPA: PadR family transcriptional regulator, partial [Paraburkholderia sp.]|nr:PadR family transcriptional regulator [Paraburkholderia sp.]